MQDHRFRLTTLGRLVLRTASGGEDPSLARRRRKLAVLAVLAVERRPLARDLLVEMFWGDQPEHRARHSLSDALSHLRRVLGTGAIGTRDAEVSLAEPAALVVDANELEEAVRRQDFARALSLYAGPFLECVYVGAGPSFERWAEAQRLRLESLFLKACEAHCVALARVERWEELGAAALRWMDAAPASVQAAQFRLRALDAPRTRESAVAALAEFERLRARLARELELEPERCVSELVECIADRLRTAEVGPLDGMAPAAAPEGAAPAAAPGTPATAAPPPEHPFVEPPPEVVVATSPALPAGARRRLRWSLVGVTALVLAAGLIVPAVRSRTAPVSPTIVAVLPFSVNGEDGYAYLRDGMVDLLSTNLDGAGVLRAVDPRALLARVADARRDGSREANVALAPDGAQAIARRFGAGLYLLGDVVAAGGRVRITAALYDARRGRTPAARGAVEGAPAELFALVDDLTRQLLAGYPDESPDRLTGLAALTTRSLPALKAYLAGVSAYRAANYEAAEEAFQTAAREDSTFALAHYQLSNTLLWAARGGWDSVANTAQRASRHAARLAPRARLLVDAYTAFRAGDFDRAERLYRSIVAAYPDEVEAWYQLGDVLYHGNAHRGRSFAEARPAFARVLEIETAHLGALLHLLRLEIWAHRHATADSLISRAAALGTPALRAELAALRAFAMGDDAQRSAALAALRDAPDEVVRVSAMRVALFTGDLDGAERISRLLLARTRAPEFQAVGRLQLADLALARGRRRAALAQLDSAAAIESGGVEAIALEWRALYLLQPFVPATRRELGAMRGELQRWDAVVPSTTFPMWRVYDGLHPHIRRYLLAMLAVRLGDLDEAAWQASALRDGAGEARGDARAFATGLAAAVDAHVLAARGAPDSAVATFERSRLAVSEGLLDAPFANQATDRYARAEVLRALGRDDEAREWYASLGETTIDLTIFAAPAQLGLARIAERHGRAAQAAAHYARVVELWRNADPELRPTVDDARRRHAALLAAPAPR